MKGLRFVTNLDDAQRFVKWDMGESWAFVPLVGWRIQFSLADFGEAREFFELEVCSIRCSADGQDIEVELHIPSYDKRSIAEWSSWLRKRMGKLW